MHLQAELRLTLKDPEPGTKPLASPRHRWGSTTPYAFHTMAALILNRLAAAYCAFTPALTMNQEMTLLVHGLVDVEFKEAGHDESVQPLP